MWSLSLPQLAATLAAALTAFQAQNAAGERLIDEINVRFQERAEIGESAA
jgi:hypothetical protein